MGKLAKTVVAKVTAATFDWDAFKGGRILFDTLRIDPKQTKTGVMGSLAGPGSPYLKIYVANEAGPDSLSLADLQAGYTLDKADMATLSIVEYEGRGGVTKFKIKGRDFAITGFPTRESAESVASVRVVAPPNK